MRPRTAMRAALGLSYLESLSLKRQPEGLASRMRRGSRLQPGTDVVKAAPFAARGLDSADFISSDQKYLICIHICISGPYVRPVKSYRPAFVMGDLAPHLISPLGSYGDTVSTKGYI